MAVPFSSVFSTEPSSAERPQYFNYCRQAGKQPLESDEPVLLYPKIPDSKHAGRGRCVAFEKYDGTNLHWTWNAEFGWIRFGTRRDDFDLFGKGIADFHAAHPGLENVAEKSAMPLPNR